MFEFLATIFGNKKKVPSSPQNYEPHQTQEFLERYRWTSKARARALEPCPSICCWFDICGFRSKLDRANWSLSRLQTDGFVEVLSEAYQRIGMPMHVQLQGASEKILVLNDAVARSLDLEGRDATNPITFAFYIRDILNGFFHLRGWLATKDLGLRTVLAGGERIQYSPESITGHSMLHYSGSPSSMGKNFLAKEFVYHPREFQMNTAFSRAYLIDSLGSKSGFSRNRVYLESNWLSVVDKALHGCIEVMSSGAGGKISISYDGRLLLHLGYDKTITDSNMKVFRLSELVVHPGLDGELVEWDLNDSN
jgi:hypothetical protein